MKALTTGELSSELAFDLHSMVGRQESPGHGCNQLQSDWLEDAPEEGEPALGLAVAHDGGAQVDEAAALIHHRIQNPLGIITAFKNAHKAPDGNIVAIPQALCLSRIAIVLHKHGNMSWCHD